MPALSSRQFATGTILAAGAIAASIALFGGGSRSQAAATANPPAALSFSELATTGRGDLPVAARDALAHAGAPKDAFTSVSSRDGFTVVVVRGDSTYLGLINDATQRATIVNSPSGEVDMHAGTWVAAGGSESGNRTSVALLVPDGVDSVEVTDTKGTRTRAEVAGNIAFVQGEDLSTAEYEFGGTKHGVDLAPRLGG